MKSCFCAKEYKKSLATSKSINTCEKVPLPKIGEQQNYIFISYSHKDYKYVYSDLADMYEAGVRFWYDSGLSAEKKWDEEVLEKLTSVYCVGAIFYMSENLFLSKSAGHEIEIARSRYTEDANPNNTNINYFSVNLTDKFPKELLISAVKNDANNVLDMKQISIISQAFPDNATYICYDSPDHAEQMIHQIRTQFGVVNDTSEMEALSVDTQSCDVFIGSFEKLTDGSRRALCSDIKEYLEEQGKSVYIVQDVQDIRVNDNLDHSLNEYAKKQNVIKLESCKNLLMISTLLGWAHLSRFLGEFQYDVLSTKKVLYLIDDACADATVFANLYKIDVGSPKGEDIMQRVLFSKSYKNRIIELLQN